MKRIFSSRRGKTKRSKQAATSRGSQALAGSISKFCRVLAVTAITAIGVRKAGAVTYYWDPASTNSAFGGGQGTWDAGTTSSWWPGSGLTTTWNNSGTIDAVFANGGDAVTIDGNVKVGSITISGPGYVLNAGVGGSIELTGGTIGTGGTVLNVANPGESATITTFLKGTVGFTKAGAGDLILNFDSSGAGGISGGITVAGGTLIFDYSGNPLNKVVAVTNALTFTNTSEFRFVAGGVGSAGASMALGALTFKGGEGTVHADANPFDDAVLTFSSLGTRAVGATGVFVQNGVIAPNRKIVITNQATGFIDQGTFFNADNFSVAPTSYAYYDAGGFVRGINYNGVDANTALPQDVSLTGIAPGSAGKHVQVTGDIAGQGDLSIRTLNLSGSTFTPGSGGISQNAGSTLTLTNAGILKSGGGDARISGGTIAVGTNEIVIRADGASDKLFINSVLTGSGGVTKSGDGSLYLNAQTSGAVSFTGSSTTAGSQTLQLAASTPATQSALAVGMAVNGPGIPANTTVLGISGSTVTLSQAATATSAIPLSYSTALDLTTPTILTLSPAEAATLTAGQTVTAANIRPGTTLVGVPNFVTVNGQPVGQWTLSAPGGSPITASTPLQTVTIGGSAVAFGATQNFNVIAGQLGNDHATTTINSLTLTLAVGVPSLVAGMSVDGPGIDPGTTIASVAGTTVTLSQVATQSSSTSTAQGPVVTALAQVGNGNTTFNVANANSLLTKDSLVTGPNIKPNTTIFNIVGNTVTLSQGTYAQQQFSATNVGGGSTTINLLPADALNLAVGTSVTGTNIAANTVIQAINVTTGAVTLSQPTTGVAGTQNITFAGLSNQSLTFGGASIAFGSRSITLTPAQAATVVVGSTVTGAGIQADTTVTGIQDFGSYKIATLSLPATGLATAEFVTFGGTTTVGINSAYGGRTLVNSGIFAVSSSGLPAPVVVSSTTTAGNGIITVANPAGLAIGMSVTGVGIPAGKVIIGISGNQITITDGTGVQGGTNNLSFQFPVRVAAGAQFAAVSSIIPNAIDLTGANAVLSAAGGLTGGGFSGAINAGPNSFALKAQDFSTGQAADLLVSGPITGTGLLIVPNGSSGIVTLSGDNSLFTGPVSIENGTTLSVARLNSLSFPATNIYSANVGGGSTTLSLTPAQAQTLVVGATVSGTNIQPNTTILRINEVTGAVTLSLPTTGAAGSQSLTFIQRTGNAVDISGTGIFKLALDGTGTAAYASGGNGTGAPQKLGLNNTINLTGGGTIQPDRDGTAYGGYFRTAANKTVLLKGLTLDAETLTIQNNSGYGVEFTGTANMNGASTFTVVNATASNVVQGLTISGLLTGGGTTPGGEAFVKKGSGTLVLGNAGNDFGGNGSVISIKAGVISIGSNGALGDAANSVAIDWNSTGGDGALPSALRATGTFSTARTIAINSSNNNIEVTGGNTFTVSSTFGLPVGLEGNPLTKGENGTLVITGNNSLSNQAFAGTYGNGDNVIQLSLANALALSVNAVGRPVTGSGIPSGTTVLAVDTTSSPTFGYVTLSDFTFGASAGNVTFAGAQWAGSLLINAGAVRILNGNALGSIAGAVTVARSGAALQLSNGATLADRLTLVGSGLNSAGALQGMGAVTNVVSNQIILSGGANTTVTVGADSGSTLNVIGGITGVSGVTLALNSAGTINITGSALDPAYTITGSLGASTTVTGISNADIANLLVGMRITGTGIQPNTTITAINTASNQITISLAATLVSPVPQPLNTQGFINLLKFGAGNAVLGVDSPTFVGSVTVNQGTFAIGGSGVTIGHPLTSSNITVQNPSGVLIVDDSSGPATVRTGNGTSTFTYTTTVGGGGNTITLSAVQAQTLTVGQTVFGTNIAPITTVTAINTTTGVVTLSANTTGAASSQTLVFGRNRNLVLAGGTFIYNGNASGSSEIFGGLTSSRGATNVVSLVPSGSGSVLLTFGSLTINGDSHLDFQGTGLGVDGTKAITFTTAPGTTNGILQRTTINGVDFVSYNNTGSASNTNGIQAFTNYNVSNNIDTAAATDTFSIIPGAFTYGALGSKTINAFKIGGGVTVGDTGLLGNTLTLTAGAILSTTGKNTVNFKVVAFGGTQGFVGVSAGSQLTVGSLLTGTGGLVKTLPGTLVMNTVANRAGYANLSGQALTGNFTVSAGKLVLAGGNNTLTPNQFLIVGPGATVNMNGTFQFAQGTRGDGAALQGNAGTFTNEAAGPSALIFGQDTGATNFGGIITQETGAGDMSFLKAGSGAYGFLNANTYKGPTVFAGGANTLLDGGTLANTSSIGINYARLTFNDDATFALANRVNLAAQITLSGGSLTYANGRTQTETTQQVGAVVLAEGQNMIQAANVIQVTFNSVGVSSAELTLASLTRPAGSSATVRFPDLLATSTTVTALNGGTLGTIGRTGRIIITASPVLSQNLIGAWAVVDREYASYIPTLGVGALNTTGFAGYSTNYLNRLVRTGGTLANPTFDYPTENIRATLNVPGLTGDTTVNTLAVNTNTAAVNGDAVPTLIDLGGRKLTLAGGGLLLALNGDNQNITIQNGTITSTGPGVGTGSDLYVQALNYGGNNRTFNINAGIADNGTGAVRLVKSSGAADTAAIDTVNANFLILNGTNTYTGGTVVNGGNLVVGATGNLPAGGITIGGGENVGVGAIFQDAGGVISSANTVTVNGLGALTLTGNNTLTGLVFRNTGGATTAPVVTTFRPVSQLGTGTLTLGAGGIVSTPLNPSSVALVAGRLDFGAAPSVVTVNAYNFASATDFAPTTAGLILQGVIGTAGGITKQGDGVLQLNGQAVFTGPLNVSAGTVQLGATNSGSRFSRLNLASGSRLNLNGFSTVLGSLAGGGVVTSTSGIATLTVGFDNTNTEFFGNFARFNDASSATSFLNGVALTKIGTGTLTMTSAQDATFGTNGGVAVNGGGLTYSGLGASFPSTLLPVTYNVNRTGTLTLDNTGTRLDNRLGLNGSQGTLNLSGGTLVMLGNATLPSNEAINVLNFNPGPSTIQLTPTFGATTTLTITTFGTQGGQDSGLITGLNLGGSGPNSVNVVINGTFSPVQGGGGAGTDNINIRPDLLGDTTGGPGTGFLIRDAGNAVRPLLPSELSANMYLTSGVTANVGLTSAFNNLNTGNLIFANQTINSLTLYGAGTPVLASGLGISGGLFGSNAAPLTLTASSGGLLALTNATISTGAIATGGITADLHVVGPDTILTLNGSILSSTAGIVKADAGTLIFNAPQYYTGSAASNGTTVNGGTLKLNGGNNTILVQPAVNNIPGVLSLFMNAGTLDLNGTSQMVGLITSNNNQGAINNAMPGTGGVIINSGGSPVTLSSATVQATLFTGSIGSGVIGGAGNGINFIKSGTGVLTLNNVNTYTGTTVIRGGGLTLQDSGTLATSAVTVNFGTLLLNEAGLNQVGVNAIRIPTTSLLTLNGGTLQQNSGGSLDSMARFENLVLGSGTSIITQSTVQSAGSSSLISIGALVQQSNAGSGPATVSFASGSGVLGGGGLNNNQVRIDSITLANGSITIPTGEVVTAISGNTITISTGTGVTTAGSTSLTFAGSSGNTVVSGSTTAGSNQVTVANPAGITVGMSVTGSSIPAATVMNGMLPGWITVNNGADFAGYLTNATNGSQGIGALGSLNFPAYATVATRAFSTVAPVAAQTFAYADAADNVSASATMLPIAGRTVNSVAIRLPGAATVIPLNLPSDTLSISSGGLLINSAQTVSIQGGRITAGSVANAAGALYATATGSGSIILNSQIVDNGKQTISGNTDGISNVISVPSTSGLVVGQKVNGPGIPVDSLITSINPNGTSFTINGNTTAASFRVTEIQKPNVSTLSGSPVITVSAGGGANGALAVGMYVSGPGIPAGTTVAALGATATPNTITLSNAATLSMSQQSYFAAVGGPPATSNQFNLQTSQAATLTPGMVVSGGTTPNNTTISSITPFNGSSSGNATANSNQITGVNTAGLLVGMGVAATGIPSGVVITAINGSTVTISNGTGVTAGPKTLSFTGNVVSLSNQIPGNLTTQLLSFGTTLNFARTGTYVAIPSNTNVSNTTTTSVTVNNNTGLVVGMAVSGPGIPAGATIASFGGAPGTNIPNSTTVNLVAPTNFFTTARLGIDLVFGNGISVGDSSTGAVALVKTGTGALTLVPQPVMNGSLNSTSTVVVPSVAGLVDGMTVSGTGIPAGATIKILSGNSFDLYFGANPIAATANSASVASTQLTFGPGGTMNGAALANSAFSNTYTGGTFVNQGTLNLGGFVGATVIPGDLTINNATVSTLTTAITAATISGGSNVIVLPSLTGLSVGMTVIGNGIPAGEAITAIDTAASSITITSPANVIAGSAVPLTFGSPGQIKNTGNVTINGGGTLNLFGANTLGGVTFNNTGGNVASTVALGTGGTLTLTNGITSVNDSLSFTPTISGTNSRLVLPNSTITTSGASPDSLLVSVPISPAGALLKAGSGSLILTPAIGLTTATTAGSASFTVVNTGGLSVGMGVSGTGIPAGESIVSIVGNTITLTTGTGVTTQASTALTFSGNTFTSGVNLSNGSLVITQNTNQLTTLAAGASATSTIPVASTTGLVAGMGVAGTGVPAGAFISSVGSGNIVITSTTGISVAANALLTFTGANTVLAGSLGTGTVNMANGTAILSDNASRTVGNAVNIAANATFGPLPGSGAAITGSSLTFTGPVTLADGVAHTITVSDLQNVTTISGKLSGGNNANITKDGTGTLILSNPSAIGTGTANTYTGTTNINVTGGVLRLGGVAAVPAGLRLSVAKGAVYDINGQLDQILLTLTNPNAGTLGEGGLVTNSSGTARTLFVGGTSTTDVTTGLGTTAIFDGVLTSATAANLALTKVGLGRQVLTGASLYTGQTNVKSGSLFVNGSLANTEVIVAGGGASGTIAGTLGGTGMIGNGLAVSGTGVAVTVQGGTSATGHGTLDLTNNSIGSFTIMPLSGTTGLALGNTTSGQSAFLNFDIGGTSTDRIDIINNGNLLVNSGGYTVNLTQLSSGPLAPGNYNLITYANASGTGSFSFGTVTGGAGGSTFASNGYSLLSTPGALVLNVGGVPLAFYWKGNLGNNWSTLGATTNWTSDAAGASPTTVIPNATAIVHFNASGFSPASLNTTLGADFKIDQLIFDSNVNALVTIGGTQSLTLNSNLLMQSGANGSVLINTSGGLVVGGSQTWRNTTANTLTVASAVTGVAPLAINSTSSGRVVLSGNNSGFSGGVTITGNGPITASVTAVQLGSATALGTGPLTVNAGALDMNGQSITVSSLISNTVSTGVIRNPNASAAAVLAISQAGTTLFSGKIGDTAASANNLSLTLDGGGTLQFITTANTYTGGTTIGTTALGGTLRLGNNGNENANSLGTGLVTINTNGTLQFSPNSTSVFNIPNSFVLNGGQIQNSGGSQRLANTGSVLGTIVIAAGGGTITPSTAANQDLFVDGVLSGSGPLTVGGTGSGKVILTNDSNSYTGTLASTSSANLQIAGSTVLATAELNNLGNGLTFGSTVTAASIGSLKGSGNFALQNTAGPVAAVTLTIGGMASPPATENYTGIISSGTLNGSLIKVGSGTQILSALNTYRGATIVNGSGALRVNNNSTTASVTGTGNLTVNNTATLGGNGVIQGGDNLTAPGLVTLNSGTFLDPGFPLPGNIYGTLRFGAQAGMVQPTTLELLSGSTYRFDVGAGAASQDRVSVVGSITIGATAKLAITAGTGGNAPDQGKYTLLSATVGVSSPFAPANITGIPTNYSVVTTANTVDLQRFSTIGSISTPALLEVIKGATVPFGVTVTNSAPTGSADLSFTATAVSPKTTGSVATTLVGAQTSGTGNGLSFNSAAAGVSVGPAQTGSFNVAASGATNGPSQPGTVTVNVYDHATYGAFAGGTLNVQPVRVGYVGPVTSTNSLAVTNGLATDYRVNLKGTAPGAIGNISLNNFTGVAPGASGNITASLTSGQAAGPYSQVFNNSYSLGDDSTLNGSNNGALGTVSITVQGSVYTGQGLWGGGSGAWSDFSKWTTTLANPGGYPGLDGDASINDTATFGSNLSSGTATLDAVAPLINSLTFNGTSGFIAPGSGSNSVTLRTNQNLVAPTITVTNGSPTFSAQLTLANTTTVSTDATSQLTISGSIGGAGGLSKVGPGTLVLSGTNGYLGKTSVSGGTLSANNSSALGASPSLVPVADQISISNNAKLAFTSSATLAVNQGITVGTGGGTIDVAGSATLTVRGALSGTAMLTKTNTGTLDLQGSIQGPLTVAANGGTLAPTVGAAAFLSTGALTFNGGTLAIDVLGNPGLGGQGNPGGYDWISTTGPVTINQPTNLTINLGFMPSPSNPDTFTFLTDGSGNITPTYNSFFIVNGQDAGVNGAFDKDANHIGKLFNVNGFYFQIDYAGGTGSDVILISAVPEPSSAALLLGGVGLLGLMSRRRPRKPPLAA